MVSANERFWSFLNGSYDYGCTDAATEGETMGGLLMTIALILPVAAGALRWPWWMIPVSGAVSVLGYFTANPSTVERLRAREGLLLAGGLAIASSTIACAVLFGLGRLLRLI
jgi:hypothetical protein